MRARAPGHGVAVDLLQTLAAHGGTATRSQLVAVSDRKLGAAVRAGLVLRTARGRYADPHAAPALIAASALDAVVSHESAAHLWRLGVDRAPAAVHLTVPRARNRGRTKPHRLPPPPVVRWADLGADEVIGRVTSPLRTVLDCATSMPFPGALAAADAALREGYVSEEVLVTAAARWHDAGRPSVVRVVLAADARATNTFESLLRGILVEEGIAGFEPQVVIEDAGPRKRVDLADVRRRIVVEADSFAWHGGRGALRRDAARYDELVAGGWLVLRFAWEHVMGRPAWVARTVREACALRDAR